MSAHGEIELWSLGLLPSYGIFRVLKASLSPPQRLTWDIWGGVGVSYGM